MEQLARAEVFSAHGEDRSDDVLVLRARAGDPDAFEGLMRRHNQRLYRVVRGVLRDDTEIEDVMQQAYLLAFAHLHQFQGTAAWSTWLCRIAFNEALARWRQRGRFVALDGLTESALFDPDRPGAADPEHQAADREVAALTEAAIDRLPEIYRSVLMLRQVEGLNTEQTAAILDVPEDVVKTRLHRARSALRAALQRDLGVGFEPAFLFGNQRCDRLVAALLQRLGVKVA
jgi:RNA polymerase sigma-70 factor (ECF subfamily)